MYPTHVFKNIIQTNDNTIWLEGSTAHQKMISDKQKIVHLL